MKVYISNYRNHWVSPYKIAEWLCWWREIEYTEPWVVRFEKIMNPPCQALKTVLDVVHPYNSYVKIDRWDTWSMDYTLGLIILPMLKQLKADKHGHPGDLTEKQWDVIMDKMIWSFEQVVEFYPDSQFWLVKPELDWDAVCEVNENGLRGFKWKQEGKLDKRGYTKHHKKIDEGLELFGKYYRALWD